MSLREAIEQFVPDGFRDEYGVWHDGPHRAAALAELATLYTQSDLDYFSANADEYFAMANDWRLAFNGLYEAVTAQLEHEYDALGYEGNTEGVEALERIKQAVAEANAERRAENSQASADD